MTIVLKTAIALTITLLTFLYWGTDEWYRYFGVLGYIGIGIVSSLAVSKK